MMVVMMVEWLVRMWVDTMVERWDVPEEQKKVERMVATLVEWKGGSSAVWTVRLMAEKWVEWKESYWAGKMVA